MAFRKFFEAECGGANPLMRFGGHITNDLAFKDGGVSGRPAISLGGPPGGVLEENQLVNEFLGQIAPPPQTFRMDGLLQEMREIDAHNFHPQVIKAAPVIDEVSKTSDWIQQYATENNGFIQEQQMIQQHHGNGFNELWDQSATMQVSEIPMASEKVVWVKEFLDVNQDDPTGWGSQINSTNMNGLSFTDFRDFGPKEPTLNNEEVTAPKQVSSESWVDDFERNKLAEAEKTDDYNQRFWAKLQEEWKKISHEGGDADHPWLTEFADFYDPYKEYNFTEENPMLEDANAFEKGKEFLANGDIPSAVLCFESAAKQNPQNPEVWEFLGISQAENEMDPYAIAALKTSLELNPNNMKVLMALAVSYTNESLQNQALKMLTRWLHCNPKYTQLVPSNLLQNEAGAIATSLIRGPELQEIQNLYLQAVKQQPNVIDADIQEALGVLFNLSSEYDKAVDCFRAALHVRPDNAKVWNRLGASLANGNRSVEAVDAYQRALRIEPGFIRARYNVGIICMNLKAFKEAAEHLLMALNFQANSLARSGLVRNNENANRMSDTIWSTLRMNFSLMGRKDLQELIDSKDLNRLNQAFNEQ